MIILGLTLERAGMPSMLEAGRNATFGKACCQFLELRLETEQCIARLREIAADGLFNCVAIPAGPIRRTHKGSANST